MTVPIYDSAAQRAHRDAERARVAAIIAKEGLTTYTNDLVYPDIAGIDRAPGITTQRDAKHTLTVKQQFDNAAQRLQAIAAEYTEFETNPQYLLTHPSIRDVRVPATAAFITALDTANTAYAYAKDTTNLRTVADFDDAVLALDAAWDAAVRTAEQLVTTNISSANRRRARRLLDRILNPTSEHEQARDMEALRDILSAITYVDDNDIHRDLDIAAIMHRAHAALTGGTQRALKK